MPQRPIDFINIVDGKIDDVEAPAQLGDVVVWIPETVDDMIDIRFLGDTPFGMSRISATHKGQAVGAVVVAKVPKNEKKGFTYTFSCKSPHLESGEPQIIVDGGSGLPPIPVRKRATKPKAGKKR